jgi:hypothetical protein
MQFLIRSFTLSQNHNLNLTLLQNCLPFYNNFTIQTKSYFVNSIRFLFNNGLICFNELLKQNFINFLLLRINSEEESETILIIDVFFDYLTSNKLSFKIKAKIFENFLEKTNPVVLLIQSSISITKFLCLVIRIVETMPDILIIFIRCNIIPLLIDLFYNANFANQTLICKFIAIAFYSHEITDDILNQPFFDCFSIVLYTDDQSLIDNLLHFLISVLQYIIEYSLFDRLPIKMISEEFVSFLLSLDNQNEEVEKLIDLIQYIQIIIF